MKIYWPLTALLLCRAETDIVRSNIDVLVSTGLGPRAEDDFLLARVTCVALLKLAKTHKVRCELFITSLKTLYMYVGTSGNGVNKRGTSLWLSFSCLSTLLQVVKNTQCKMRTILLPGDWEYFL